MSSTERRIKSLKTRQKSLLTSFQLVVKFVDGYEEETDCYEVPVRLEHLVSIWNDFNAVQGELETLDDTNVEAHLQDRIAFETSYFKAKGFLLSVSKPTSTPTTPSSSQSQPFSTTSHVRLPDIKLPVFDGTLDRWLNFHDLFISLVHSSHELSNIQKFYYLRSSLTGEALKLVQTIAISANNYMVAWNLLLDHYQNPIRLKQSYVDSLFEFAPIRRESATELHSLVEKFEANVKILKQLGERTECWDLILIRMLSIRLDSVTRRDWEEYCATQQAVTFQDLTSFIQRRVTVLQTIGKATEVSSSIPAKKPQSRPLSSHAVTHINSRKCLVCPDSHPLYQCNKFSKMNIEEKEKEIRRHQLCRNCLRKGHPAKECPSSSTCRRCRGHHHTQICPQSECDSSKSKAAEASPPADTSVQSAASPPSASVSATLEISGHAAVGAKPKRVLLATAIIIVVDDSGREFPARALLDSGSECSFVTESFSQLIKARRRKVHLPISGIGQSKAHVRSMLLTTIRSRINEYTASVELLVMPKVTMDLPSSSLDVSTWKIPSEIQLADPAFYKTSSIDIVLGAELFFDLFSMSGRIDLGINLPVLVNSVFGWIVTGSSVATNTSTPIAANLALVTDLHQLMESFWSMEEGATTSCLSVEEVACEEHFQKTTKRSEDGRYIVRLPVKENILDNLDNNRRTATRRFRMLESRFATDANLQEQYSLFMSEYLSLGHMTRIVDYQQPRERVYHLPHHAVIREDSTTTKMRVVFDASCRTSTGSSLNDALMVGPTLQQDLRSILMRSRMHRIMIIADIKQMFRQILVDPLDTPLQRIVWRSSNDAPLDTYELKTVTYGTASAPFLATRVLKQLADDERTEFPEAAEILINDFYVDDLISGANSTEEARIRRKQLDSLLNRGGFQLRKWASNEPDAIADVSPENLAMQPSVDLDRDQCIKTLGLHWEPQTDCLRYKVQLPGTLKDETLTKRTALSYIARLFDPLGLVGPVVTTAKLFMQSLWLLQDSGRPWGWDKELPSSLQERWLQYEDQLPLLNELRIDRLITCQAPETVQLHIFSDSSEKAYGACAYIRSTDPNGLVKSALLTSKSKVAPIKQQSIPRLELCGALLAAELYQKISASMRSRMETFFWVDSTTVLSWLKCTPSTWTTFVANRVSKIQLATKDCTWNHIAGKENPADILSRGATPEALLNCTLWWTGPTWLQWTPNQWPTEFNADLHSPTISREARRAPAVALNVHHDHERSFIDEFVARFSNYQRMLRITAYCNRFLRNCRKRSRKVTITDETFLSSEEIKVSEATLIALIQQQAFSVEWKQLSEKRPLSTKSKLRWFNPFMSDEGIIRIGGRLTHALQPFDSKHQILLPAHHPYSHLLVKQVHDRNLHAQPQLLLTLLRDRYWIIGARSLARKVVHTCIACFRAHPKRVEQFMADLPSTRVTAARPFGVTGVDYWGPLHLRPVTRRSAARKAYVAVFVCFCTKAVHIELVVDLTTAKFMQAFRRFTSRRGLCSQIYSDNGRNFVGASNELRKLLSSNEYRQAFALECTSNDIKWHFNPPKASHFGGLWESAIASAQKHLFRVLGPHKLDYDDMETLLTQIECCLNSRPIIPISDDPTDLQPLTPGHFLIGSPLKAVPDEDVSAIPFNRLQRWQQTQKIFQDVWKRWNTEYLSSLQPRTKWCQPPVAIERGRLVIIRQENCPPMHWPTARIMELHPGPDGITRVVTVRTADGIYTRPVSKICLLPVPTNSSTEGEHPKFPSSGIDTIQENLETAETT